MASASNANSERSQSQAADPSRTLLSTGQERPKSGRVPNAYKVYRRSQIETASPSQLLLMLFDGCIRFCGQALEAMKTKNLETQNTNLLKAQRIVSQLMGSLDREVGGEIADNLTRLYGYMLRALVSANLYDNQRQVEEVITMLTELRTSFQEADRQLAKDAVALARNASADTHTETPTAPPSTARASTAAPPARPRSAVEQKHPSAPAPEQRRLGDQHA